MKSATTITIKTDKKLRDDAKRTAAKLGVPLTTAVNAMLKQFVRDERLVLEEYYTLRPEVARELERESEAMDREENPEVFTNVQDLIAASNRLRTKAKRKP